MPRGRKFILENEQTLTAIREVLAETGSVQEVLKVCQFSMRSWTRWLDEQPDFVKLVESAKAVYYAKAKERAKERRAIAEAYLDKILRGEVYRTKKREKFDPEGNLVETETTVEQVLLSPSSGYFETLLPKADDEDSTIRVVVDFSDDAPVS